VDGEALISLDQAEVSINHTSIVVAVLRNFMRGLLFAL
jgi:hypothetical protein